LYIPTLFCVTVLVFALMRLVPGDAAYMRLSEYGADITAENLDAARRELGLGGPIWEQYARWLGRAARFDFGRSSITNRPAFQEFAVHVDATARLSLPALIAAIMMALICGVFSAMYAGGWFDRVSRAFTALFMSAPSFCVGLPMILLFSVKLRWLPSFGAGSAKHMILPCATLAVGIAAGYTRFIRTAMLEEFSSEYVRAARARGVPARVIVWRGALRNALTPIVTSLGMSLGLLLGGSAVVETIFSWPGVGKYLVDAVMKRDYAVVQCCALCLAAFFATLNLAADITCMALDPKLRRRRPDL
jgi:glutathione transport system permease protein